MPLFPSLPHNATVADLRALYGEVMDRMQPYAQRLMRGPSPLTPGQRELIGAYVSGVNRCQLCYGAHSLIAQEFGVDEFVFKTLLEDIDLAPVDGRLKPILRYVRKLTEAPSRMTKADLDAVLQAGWSEEALFHAIAVCAYFNYVNRLIDGVGMEGTSAACAFGADALLKYGYGPESSGG